MLRACARKLRAMGVPQTVRIADSVAFFARPKSTIFTSCATGSAECKEAHQAAAHEAARFDAGEECFLAALCWR